MLSLWVSYVFLWFTNGFRMVPNASGITRAGLCWALLGSAGLGWALLGSDGLRRALLALLGSAAMTRV